MINAKKVYEYSHSLDVLYVEDDLNLREETAAMLESFFKRLDTAVDGKDGLDRYHEHLYDIIITDINMPRMNGIDMIKQIREIHPEQKIIAISAHNEGDILVNLIKAGISNFILKPIIQSDILNALYPVCRDAHAQKVNIELFEALNEERAKLEKQIKLLETQVHATETKHHQVEQLLQEKSTAEENAVINEYFSKDEDEGEENVLFMKDDCDEMLEMFAEMPELMMQYTIDHDISHVHLVLHYLSKISSILLHYTPFLDPLAKSFEELALTIRDNLDTFTVMFESSPDSMLMVWDAVSVDMERYMHRFSEESMAMKNIHHIHHPTTLSIQQIITMLNPPEEDDGEIEFF